MGTDAWETWHAARSGQAIREHFDVELHSDALFVGGAGAYGPFTLRPVIRKPGQIGSALGLSFGVRSLLLPELIVDNELAKPHTDGYHGGTISDEIAALVSLLLGVRVRSAGTVRASGLLTANEAPPEPLDFEPAHFLRPGPPDRELLPNLTARVVDLADLDLLRSFPELDEKSQTALVRSARSYASAIWWANEDPNLAWLQLVTAVEVIAKHQQTAKQDSVALLEEIWPGLYAPLSKLDGAPSSRSQASSKISSSRPRHSSTSSRRSALSLRPYELIGISSIGLRCAIIPQPSTATDRKRSTEARHFPRRCLRHRDKIRRAHGKKCHSA